MIVQISNTYLWYWYSWKSYDLSFSSQVGALFTMQRYCLLLFSCSAAAFSHPHRFCSFLVSFVLETRSSCCWQHTAADYSANCTLLLLTSAVVACMMALHWMPNCLVFELIIADAKDENHRSNEVNRYGLQAKIIKLSLCAVS